MEIYNNRKINGYTYLRSPFWSGLLVGTDGYPFKLSGYCIGGSKDVYFKATAIEFYGVKKQV